MSDPKLIQYIRTTELFITRYKILNDGRNPPSFYQQSLTHAKEIATRRGLDFFEDDTVPGADLGGIDTAAASGSEE